MVATPARTRAHRRGCMKILGPAPLVLGLFATAATLAWALAPAAAAHASRSMRPVVTRVHVHDGRLWRKRSARWRYSHARLPVAHAAIVGGTPISIAQVPWQVVVIAFPEPELALLCGGSILSETEILTAGHCVFNPGSKDRIAPEDILVGAGSDNIEFEPEQVKLAGGVRVHPGYNPSAALPAPDDVAVLKLKTPLVLNSDVQPIGPRLAGPPLQEGLAVDLSGFGAENPSTELNGRLYAIGMTLKYSRECGGEADALFVCASAPNGSPCFGDSGSALTLPEASAGLVGVMDTIQVIGGKPCLAGSLAGFANVAAPEIRDFIVEGNENPPLAPRGGGASIRGTVVSGHALSCEPGNWSNSPTFTYTFINSAGGEVIQQGSSSAYTLGAADVGRSILCEVLATTAGGTGVGRTPAIGPIRHSPQEEEEAVNKKREEEEAAKRKREAEAGAQAAKRAAEAAAVKRHEEELANGHPHGEEAKTGVLGTHETSKSRHLTRAQLLARALKACRREPRRKRARCMARAHRRYGSPRGASRRRG
jgi:hypothetical protein